MVHGLEAVAEGEADRSHRIEPELLTRNLVAGTVIGSGTLSTADHARAGSSCISERRAIDAISGRTPTPFLRFGDRVRMEATHTDGSAPFGAIDQRVIKA